METLKEHRADLMGEMLSPPMAEFVATIICMGKQQAAPTPEGIKAREPDWRLASPMYDFTLTRYERFDF